MIDQYVWWRYLSERQTRWNEEHPDLFEEILKQIEECEKNEMDQR